MTNHKHWNRVQQFRRHNHGPGQYLHTAPLTRPATHSPAHQTPSRLWSPFLANPAEIPWNYLNEHLVYVKELDRRLTTATRTHRRDMRHPPWPAPIRRFTMGKSNLQTNQEGPEAHWYTDALTSGWPRSCRTPSPAGTLKYRWMEKKLSSIKDPNGGVNIASRRGGERGSGPGEGALWARAGVAGRRWRAALTWSLDQRGGRRRAVGKGRRRYAAWGRRPPDMVPTAEEVAGDMMNAVVGGSVSSAE